MLRGQPVLKAFGRSADEREKVRTAGEALRGASIATLRVAFPLALVLDTLASVSVALVAVPLGLRLLDGSMGLSSALAVLVIAPEVFVPLRRASAEFHESSEGLAAAADAYSTIDSATVPDTWSTLQPLRARPAASATALRTRDRTRSRSARSAARSPARHRTCSRTAASSSRPGRPLPWWGRRVPGSRPWWLRCWDCSRPAPARFASVDAALEDIEPAAWRERLAYLPDRPALISGSLADNLRIAKPDAGDDELVRTLAAVSATRMLASMPSGLQTLVGEGGRPVSAGERQRIGLARNAARGIPVPARRADSAPRSRLGTGSCRGSSAGA